MTVGENVLYLKDVNKAIERIAELEKENEQLKYNLKCRDDELAELKAKLKRYEETIKAEINQIIERERVVPEHYLCEMIDKVHCCQMCKHLLNGGSCLKGDTEEVKKWENFLIETRRKNFCKNWELAE